MPAYFAGSREDSSCVLRLAQETRGWCPYTHAPPPPLVRVSNGWSVICHYRSGRIGMQRERNGGISAWREVRELSHHRTKCLEPIYMGYYTLRTHST